MSTIPSNKISYLMAIGAVHPLTDSFKIILMASGFAFDRDTHHGYADVSASELATGYGYIQNTKTLAGVVVTEDDVDNRTEITWNDVTWTAVGGAIGPTPGAIIFDDTVAAPTADPIMGYIDFGTEQTQASGGVATISNIEFRISTPTT